MVETCVLLRLRVKVGVDLLVVAWPAPSSYTTVVVHFASVILS